MDWIFIRGLVREAAHWGDWGAAFERAFPDARVTYLNLPGNGAHHKVRTPLSVPAMTDWLRDEAKRRGVVKPNLVALSLGGMVACDWAQRHPEELSGAVFVNTSFGGYSPLLHRFRPQAVPITIRASRMGDLYQRERRLLRITSNSPHLYDSTAARWAGVARARPVSRVNALRQMFAAATFRPPRVPPKVPYLIVVGEGDKLVEPRCSHAIADAWHAPIAAHPTAGHDLTLDAGPWLIEQISAWLKARADA